MINFENLSTDMKNSANPEKAAQMSAYMRNQFDFLGVPTPKRREICKPYFKTAKKDTQIDWGFVNACWKEPHREFQYCAVNYLELMKGLLTPASAPKIKKLVTTKSWWDTVDGLDVIMGHIALQFPDAKQILLDWSTDKNFWLRRAAIDHQLLYRDKTDVKLFEKILVNNFGQSEFFINKAIGWSLREYSKTNPSWVRNFIKRYGDKLAPLSVREAGKYV